MLNSANIAIVSSTSMVKQHEVYSPQDLGQTKQNGGSTFCVKYEYLKMILDVFQNMVSQKQIFSQVL